LKDLNLASRFSHFLQTLFCVETAAVPFDVHGCGRGLPKEVRFISAVENNWEMKKL